MRISDWSSDVFSSDLFGRLVEDPARGVELVVQHRRARALQAFLQVGRGFVAGDDRVAAERGQQAVAGDACGIEQLIALCLAALHQAVAIGRAQAHRPAAVRSEEHTSELKSLMSNSYAVLCVKKKKKM